MAEAEKRGLPRDIGLLVVVGDLDYGTLIDYPRTIRITMQVMRSISSRIRGFTFL